MKTPDRTGTILVWSGIFAAVYYLTVEHGVSRTALFSALKLLHWYAREHVLLCLVPAFFIAGVVTVFISREAVIKHLGADAPRVRAYLTAAVSGSILAVCSCTILPLFAGIRKRGAGLGPAIAFLYSGPAVNILAVILTARILGWKLGTARLVGAVFFSLLLGGIMEFIYRREPGTAEGTPKPAVPGEKTLSTAGAFLLPAVLTLILISATVGPPAAPNGFWALVYAHKWLLTAVFGLLLVWPLVTTVEIPPARAAAGVLLVAAGAFLLPGRPQLVFSLGTAVLVVLGLTAKSEARSWMQETWNFARQILPLLGAGILLAGFLLGTPQGEKGIIPATWIAHLVGGNSPAANFFAAVSGAFMYFATLTEVPILQGLISNGMGQGPALALLLAGPALSLPNMLVIRKILGTEKTLVYVGLVVIISALSGMIFGLLG